MNQNRMEEGTVPVNGWIKLSRGIRQNWVWNNPNWLKWWLDLLLLAAWEDTVIRKRRRRVLVKRGEVVMSVRELQRRWGLRSCSTVQDFLVMLIEEEMIEKSVRKAMPLSKEQDSEQKAEQKVEQKAEQNSEQKVEQNSEQSAEQSSEQNGEQSAEHFFTVIIICNYDSFQSLAAGAANTFANTLTNSKKNTSPNKKPNNSANSKAHTSPNTNSNSNPNTNSNTINKNNKNKRNLVVVDVDVREEEKVDVFDEAAFRAEMLFEGTNRLLESACAEMQIPEEEGREIFKQILKEWKAREFIHADRDKAVTHLFAHVRKKVEARRKQQGAASARESARAAALANARQAMERAMGSAAPPPPQPRPLDGGPTAEQLEAMWENVPDAPEPYDDYDEIS